MRYFYWYIRECYTLQGCKGVLIGVRFLLSKSRQTDAAF